MADLSSQDSREKSPHERLAALETEFQSLGKEFIDLSDKIYVLEKKLQASNEFVFNRESSIKMQAEKDAESLACLQEQLEKLEERSANILFQINEIHDEHPIVEDFEKLIPELSVIVFVNELEKADQYFDFKQHLRSDCDFIKHDSAKEDVIEKLCTDFRLKSKFNRLDRKLIKHAVHAVIWEMRVEDGRLIRRPSYIKYLKELHSGMLGYSDDDFERMAGDWTWLDLSEREMDEYGFIHPISRLVFETREKHNVMAEQPKEEMKKIFKLDPLFYDGRLMYDYLREEFEKIKTTNEDMLLSDIEELVCTKLFEDALVRYNVFRTRYSETQTEDMEPACKG